MASKKLDTLSHYRRLLQPPAPLGPPPGQIPLPSTAKPEAKKTKAASRSPAASTSRGAASLSTPPSAAAADGSTPDEATLGTPAVRAADSGNTEDALEGAGPSPLDPQCAASLLQPDEDGYIDPILRTHEVPLSLLKTAAARLTALAKGETAKTRAVMMMADKQWTEALAEINDAIYAREKYCTGSWAHYLTMRSQCHLKMNRADAAEADARRALIVDPTWHEGHLRLAQALDFKAKGMGPPPDPTKAAVIAGPVTTPESDTIDLFGDTLRLPGADINFDERKTTAPIHPSSASSPGQEGGGDGGSAAVAYRVLRRCEEGGFQLPSFYNAASASTSAVTTATDAPSTQPAPLKTTGACRGDDDDESEGLSDGDEDLVTALSQQIAARKTVKATDTRCAFAAHDSTRSHPAPATALGHSSGSPNGQDKTSDEKQGSGAAAATPESAEDGPITVFATPRTLAQAGVVCPPSSTATRSAAGLTGKQREQIRLFREALVHYELSAVRRLAVRDRCRAIRQACGLPAPEISSHSQFLSAEVVFDALNEIEDRDFMSRQEVIMDDMNNYFDYHSEEPDSSDSYETTDDESEDDEEDVEVFEYCTDEEAHQDISSGGKKKKGTKKKAVQVVDDDDEWEDDEDDGDAPAAAPKKAVPSKSKPPPASANFQKSAPAMKSKKPMKPKKQVAGPAAPAAPATTVVNDTAASPFSHSPQVPVAQNRGSHGTDEEKENKVDADATSSSATWVFSSDEEGEEPKGGTDDDNSSPDEGEFVY